MVEFLHEPGLASRGVVLVNDSLRSSGIERFESPRYGSVRCLSAGTGGTNALLRGLDVGTHGRLRRLVAQVAMLGYERSLDGRLSIGHGWISMAASGDRP